MAHEIIIDAEDSEETVGAGADLVPVADIQKFVDLGAVSKDLDHAKLPAQRARWENGDTAGDRSVAAAYRAVEEGRQLVDLHSVIAKGGKYPINKRLPALALIPAFSSEVIVKAHYHGHVTFRALRGRLRRPWRFEVATQNLWERSEAIWESGVAKPPPMPPDIREVAEPDDLVLWEATWQRINTKVPRPPIHLDPALLEHVTGSLWVVKKTWDLTELEAAALR